MLAPAITATSPLILSRPALTAVERNVSVDRPGDCGNLVDFTSILQVFSPITTPSRTQRSDDHRPGTSRIGCGPCPEKTFRAFPVERYRAGTQWCNEHRPGMSRIGCGPCPLIVAPACAQNIPDVQKLVANHIQLRNIFHFKAQGKHTVSPGQILAHQLLDPNP